MHVQEKELLISKYKSGRGSKICLQATLPIAAKYKFIVEYYKYNNTFANI